MSGDPGRGRSYPDLLDAIAKVREGFADWAGDPDGWIPMTVAAYAVDAFNLARAIGYPLESEAPDVHADAEAVVAAMRACLARRNLEALKPADGPVPEPRP